MGKREILVGFGGEHGVTYPILKSLAETGKKWVLYIWMRIMITCPITKENPTPVTLHS